MKNDTNTFGTNVKNVAEMAVLTYIVIKATKGLSCMVVDAAQAVKHRKNKK